MWVEWLIADNDQIWRVAIPFVKSTNVVKLPNHHNSIHEELRLASQNPERKKWLEAQKLAEWRFTVKLH